MEVKWIKIAVDVFDNRKIRQIETLPDGDTLIVIWFKILALAGEINDSGLVYFAKNIPFTEQMLSAYFRRPLPVVQMALQIFQQYGMIEITDDFLMVSNWEKYQNVESLETVREQTRNRVRAFRERQKALLPCNDTVTLHEALCNGTDKDIDIDKEEDSNTNVQKVIAKDFEILWEAYPKKQGKKQAFAAFARDRRQGISPSVMMEGIQKYCDYIKKMKVSYDYIKMGSTFFSQRAWQDDWTIGETPVTKSPETGGRNDLEDMKRFLKSMEG